MTGGQFDDGNFHVEIEDEGEIKKKMKRVQITDLCAISGLFPCVRCKNPNKNLLWRVLFLVPF